MTGRADVRLVAVLALVCVCAPAPSAWGWYPYEQRYAVWQKDRPLTISGWMSGPPPRDKIPERVARCKAAGLNQVYFHKLIDWHLAGWVRAVRQSGLEWTGGMAGGPPKVGIRKAMTVGGASAIIVLDEPNDREEDYRKIEERIAWVHEKYPTLPAFVNLSIMELDHDKYVTRCKPDVFSFDYYPLYRGERPPQTGFFLHLLNLGRATSRKYKLPYWMFTQAYGRPHDKPISAYRIPDQADLRFLVFSFLAHGGIGVQFFTYRGWAESMIAIPPQAARKGDSGVLRYERSHPSRSYFALKDMAPEIRALGPALLNLRTAGTVTYAGSIPDSDRRLKPFSRHGALRSVQVVENPRDPVLVSFFDDRAGQEYFMLVNLVHGKNMSKIDGRRTVRLSFTGGVTQIERLNRLTGRVETLRTAAGRGRSRILNISLEGGTGDLFKWSNGKPWALRSPRNSTK